MLLLDLKILAVGVCHLPTYNACLFEVGLKPVSKELSLSRSCDCLGALEENGNRKRKMWPLRGHKPSCLALSSSLFIWDLSFKPFVLMFPYHEMEGTTPTSVDCKKHPSSSVGRVLTTIPFPACSSVSIAFYSYNLLLSQVWLLEEEISLLLETKEVRRKHFLSHLSIPQFTPDFNFMWHTQDPCLLW